MIFLVNFSHQIMRKYAIQSGRGSFFACSRGHVLQEPQIPPIVDIIL